MLGQAAALALTLAVEAPIVLAATRRGPRGWPWRVAAALVPSAVTHPFAWHAAGNFGAHDYLVGLLLIETLVIAAETPLLRVLAGLRWGRALLLALAANAASTLAGMLLA